jgi:hypothetical protein
MVVGPNHNLYVAAQDNLAYGIFVVQPGATGLASGQYNAIAGSNTGLASGNPQGIGVDAAGYIYVGIGTTGGSSIAVFAPGVYGNVAPVRVISGTNTSVSEPVVIGAKPDGTLYVLDYGSATVYVFAPGAGGNVSPLRAFESPSMPYHGPAALDPSGNVYALNEASLTGPFPIIVFGAASSGLVQPLFQLSGSNTGINTPTGLSVAP